MAKGWNDVKHKKEDVIKELKAMPDSTAKTQATSKVTAIKNWPPDSGTEAAVKKLYDEAAKATANAGPQTIDVALKSYTKPKFAHNATNAGTLPKWTFQYVDTDTKKKGEVEITMTTAMTKDEPTAKKLMSEAAVAEVKKHYPGATVKVNNTSLNS
jgi:hypothetical protein